MKIVIPTNTKKGLNDKIAEHFGRCLTYTFLNEKGELIKIINNSSEHMGGAGLPPELMKKHGFCKGLSKIDVYWSAIKYALLIVSPQHLSRIILKHYSGLVILIHRCFVNLCNNGQRLKKLSTPEKQH